MKTLLFKSRHWAALAKGQLLARPFFWMVADTVASPQALGPSHNEKAFGSVGVDFLPQSILFHQAFSWIDHSFPLHFLPSIIISSLIEKQCVRNGVSKFSSNRSFPKLYTGQIVHIVLDCWEDSWDNGQGDLSYMSEECIWNRTWTSRDFII